MTSLTWYLLVVSDSISTGLLQSKAAYVLFYQRRDTDVDRGPEDEGMSETSEGEPEHQEDDMDIKWSRDSFNLLSFIVTVVTREVWSRYGNKDVYFGSVYKSCFKSTYP